MRAMVDPSRDHVNYSSQHTVINNPPSNGKFSPLRPSHGKDNVDPWPLTAREHMRQFLAPNNGDDVPFDVFEGGDESCKSSGLFHAIACVLLLVLFLMFLWWAFCGDGTPPFSGCACNVCGTGASGAGSVVYVKGPRKQCSI